MIGVLFLKVYEIKINFILANNTVILNNFAAQKTNPDAF